MGIELGFITGSIYDRGLYHQGPHVNMTITDHLFLPLNRTKMVPVLTNGGINRQPEVCRMGI